MELITQDNLKFFIPYLTLEAAKAIYIGKVFAIGYTYEGLACGAVSAEIYGETAKIYSIFTDEKIRRKGIGKTLLKEMCYQLNHVFFLQHN